MAARSPSERILLTGASGQLGGELLRTLAPFGEVVPFDRSGLDLGDSGAVRATVRSVQPEVIVNAAAYTRVDGAESERDLAQRINGVAPAILAEEARRLGAVMIHYSTDYVFDGQSTRPYTEDQPLAPINQYGRTKAFGDRAVLASGAMAYVFRVSWVYGKRGKNFFRTVQRLVAERQVLRMVADQHGAPTWCGTIAETSAGALAQILAARQRGMSPPPAGVYHMTSADNTTWYGFAEAIVQAMASHDAEPPAIQAIATADYPSAARRPASSIMSAARLERVFGLRLPSWREQLELCLTS